MICLFNIIFPHDNLPNWIYLVYEWLMKLTNFENKIGVEMYPSHIPYRNITTKFPCDPPPPPPPPPPLWGGFFFHTTSEKNK